MSGIRAFCRYWEGGFVSGGWKRRLLLQSGGWKCCSRGRGCLEICLKAACAGESLSSCPRNSENVAAFSEFLCPPPLLGRNFPPALIFRTSASRTGRVSWVTFPPSLCDCALLSRELWSIWGRFGWIGRVFLSREGGNGAYYCNREGGNVAVGVVVAWRCV